MFEVKVKFDSLNLMQMNTRQWQSISERARDLVLCMMTVDPKERITADGVLSHPWLLVRFHLYELFVCFVISLW